MKLEIHSGIGSVPVVIDANRVVVFDSHNNPIAFIIQFNEGQIRICHAGEKDFFKQLKMNGIEDTVIVNKIKL
ncbi:MAG: hypothetical protein KatS3mg035_1802 [Bacteroidia bacterium]|nr:MAG: hypothetical protein KatS3mg035_1802 [Bacteroidia bacterium]